MADDFRTVFPIEAFDGGLNDKYEANILADNESSDCLNVYSDNVGGVKTRLGYKKLNTASVGSFTGEGLFTCRFNDGTETLVGWWNGSMYKLTGTSFITIPSAQSVFTAGTRVDFGMYQNLAFFGNGGSKPYKWNGTEFTRMGIPQPNSGPSVATGAAGNVPAGDVNYKVSYVNSYLVEGDVSAATTTLTVAASATASLTSLPLAPTSFGVASRKIYRKDSTTAGAYKLVTTINDNTTTNYTDTTDSASLSTTAPTDQGEPPNWKYIRFHQERGFLVDPSNPQLVYYTELGTPFVVKATNFNKVENGDGENVTGLGIHANSVAVYKDASVWLIYMQDTTPGNWSVLKSNSKYGGASHYAIADYNQLQLFVGKRYNVLSGFHALAGLGTKPTNTQLLTTAVFSESQSDRIEPQVFSFNTANIFKSCAIEYKNRIWVCVPSSSSTVPDKVYVFEYQRRAVDNTTGAWWPLSYPVGFSAFSIFDGKLYGQSSTANGFTYQLESAAQYNDDGTAIDSYYWSKEFPGLPKHIENWKDFRFANFIIETLGAYYMNVIWKVDADLGAGTTYQVNLDSGGSIWGVLVWGGGVWGGGQGRRKVTIPLGKTSGKRIQFRFDNQNTINQAFHVYPLGTFSYNVKGKR